MTHVLVTGAGGYIGSVLVGELLTAGYAVTAVDRFFFGEETLGGYAEVPSFRLVKGDVRDITPPLLEGVDVICDLAALSNDPSGDLDPELTYAVNYRARARLAKLASQAGVKHYILSSSCSVYGHGHGAELTETAPTTPLTIYAKSNLQAEEEALAQTGGDLTVTVLRNATVFGLSPRMRFDLVVNLMTLHAVRKGRIFVMGGGKQWRPLVHVRDVAGTFRAVIEAPKATVTGQTFNVGIQNMQVLTLAYVVRENLPFPLQIEVAPDDADKRNYNVSFRKLHEVLGYQPRVNICEGVKEIYEALKNGTVDDGPKTSTVNWYRTILDARALIDRVELDGRLL